MMGLGMPLTLYLEQFGQVCRDVFGEDVYHVGSSMGGDKTKAWRDVDVRAILDDADYAAWGLGHPKRPHSNAKWVGLTLAFSALGKHMTGLPIDFQVQQRTEANAEFSSKDGHCRSALGIMRDVQRYKSETEGK